MSGPPKDYVEVSERIAEFRDKYPEGSLQSEMVISPVDGYIIVQAYAYRTPDDPRPGSGLAWEPVPGKTNFTRDSELMNAETSAWGRALIAVGAADAKRGIASANEVRNRQQPKREPTSPKTLIKDRLWSDGVSLDAFAKWLEEQYGTSKLDELQDADRVKVVKAVTSGAVTDKLKVSS